VFQHSWNLLTADEQAVFRRLAVFSGGWDEAAARQVVGASLPALVSLVDKSLLRQGSDGRFDVHEVLRQYAAEQLDALDAERAAVQRRHAEYYLAFAESARDGLRGAAQAGWLARLEQEHDNLRVALQWAREQQAVELAFRLAAALWWFWYVRGHFSEGRAQLAAVLALAPPDAALATPSGLKEALVAAKAEVLNGAGGLAMLQGASTPQALSMSRAWRCAGRWATNAAWPRR
jgi:predicted ATPase